MINNWVNQCRRIFKSSSFTLLVINQLIISVAPCADVLQMTDKVSTYCEYYSHAFVLLVIVVSWLLLSAVVCHRHHRHTPLQSCDRQSCHKENPPNLTELFPLCSSSCVTTTGCDITALLFSYIYCQLSGLEIYCTGKAWINTGDAFIKLMYSQCNHYIKTGKWPQCVV